MKLYRPSWHLKYSRMILAVAHDFWKLQRSPIVSGVPSSMKVRSVNDTPTYAMKGDSNDFTASLYLEYLINIKENK